MPEAVFDPTTLPVDVTLTNGNKTATSTTGLAFDTTPVKIKNTFKEDTHIIEFTLDVGGDGIGVLPETAPIFQVLDTGSATIFASRDGSTNAIIGPNTTGALADLVAGDIVTFVITFDDGTVSIYLNGVLEFTNNAGGSPVGVGQASVILGTAGTQVTVNAEDTYQIARPSTALNWSTKFEFDPFRISQSQSIDATGLIVTQLNDVFGGKTWALQEVPTVSSKRYMEFTVTLATGGSRVGAVSSGLGASIGTTAALGRRSTEIGYDRLGSLIVNNSAVQVGLTVWGAGDVVSMLADDGVFSFWVNGTPTGAPQAIGGSTGLLAGVGVGLTPTVITANFGATNFVHTMPVDFIAWNAMTPSTLEGTITQCANDISRDIRMYEWVSDLLIDETTIDMTVTQDYSLTGFTGQEVYLVSVPSNFNLLLSGRAILTAGPITLV